MKKIYKKLFTILTAFFCTAVGISQNYNDGIFILGEGLFGTDTATVSFVNPDGTLESDIFAAQNNGNILGNTAQGMGFNGDFAYIILNGSNAVKVVNRITFTEVATITDQMENPRNIAFFEGKGYVTNWGDGGVTTDDFVAVIDLATNTVTETISVVEGPEEILQNNGKLYIAQQGGFGFGNTVSVIDTADNSVSLITVGDVPNALRIDENNLYVLCSGKPNYTGEETAGKLVKISLADNSDVVEITFSDLAHPSFMGITDANLYYVLDSSIYKMGLTDTTLPTDEFIDITANNVQIPYGFNVVDGKLFLGDAVDFVSDGKVVVYNEDGSFSTEYTVGPLPNGFYKYEDAIMGIEDFTALNISVYPNPTTGSFDLNTFEKANIAIYDFAGRLVKTVQYNNQPISVNGLNAGLYLVQLTVEGKTSTQKLIIL